MDRNTVTSTLGDATVTIGGRFTAPAKVVFIHPLHNFALVQFDPKTVPDSIEVGQARRGLPLSSTRDLPEMHPPRLRRRSRRGPRRPERVFRSSDSSPGSTTTSTHREGSADSEPPSSLRPDQAWLNLHSIRQVDLIARKTRVANCGWMKLPMPNPPRYQLHNVETLGLEMAPSLDGGVLVRLLCRPRACFIFIDGRCYCRWTMTACAHCGSRVPSSRATRRSRRLLSMSNPPCMAQPA